MAHTGGSTQKDNELETRINAICDALLAAPIREQKQKCAERVAALVGQRSPERIDLMERERGLR